MKNTINKDIKFIKKCEEYGIYYKNSIILDNVILLYTSIKKLYIVLDKNYNTIGIEYFKNNLNAESNSFHFKYSYLKNGILYGKGFNLPFQNYTLRQIIDLSNQIEITETEQSDSIDTRINGQLIDRETKENETYAQVLSYIKFLGYEIQEHFLASYNMLFLNQEAVDIYTYISNTISKLDECIEFYVSNKVRPWPLFIANYINTNLNNREMYLILSDIADLLVKQKGYRINSNNRHKVEYISENQFDITKHANNILNIFDKENNDKVLVKKQFK